MTILEHPDARALLADAPGLAPDLQGENSRSRTTEVQVEEVLEAHQFL